MNVDQLRLVIIARRKERKLTQAQLGLRTRIRREVISRFESARQTIDLDQLVRICDALDLELVLRPGRGRPVLEELDSLFKDEDE
jgi:transcriptional regulator with XRE-family HTH domain